MSNRDDLTVSKDEVVSSFKGLIAGAEDLLKTTASAGSDKADMARRKLSRYIDSARDALDDIEGLAKRRYREASETTDVFVRSNPWQAVGIAVAAGLLVGLLAGRRQD